MRFVNPRQARDFAKATGRLAKTDRIDAEVLAHFAEAVRPTPKAVPDEETREFSFILARRRQIVEMLTAEKNRLGAMASKPVKKRIEAHVRWLEKELESTDSDLDETIRASAIWRENEELLKSVPGVGPVLARTLLAESCPSWVVENLIPSSWQPWWVSLLSTETPARCAGVGRYGADESA